MLYWLKHPNFKKIYAIVIIMLDRRKSSLNMLKVEEKLFDIFSQRKIKSGIESCDTVYCCNEVQL
jgi:hypothetical protein